MRQAVPGTRSRAAHGALLGATLIALLGATLIALLAAPARAQDPTGDVLARVNQERARNGLSALARIAELDTAARRHSLDMATNNFFSHTGSDQTSAGDRANAAGYHWYTWGENIAAGYPTAQAVMDGWMNSPGHRANILNPNFRDIGIAAVTHAGSRYGIYWTQVFGARTGGTTPPPPPDPTPTPAPTPTTPATKPTPKPSPRLSLLTPPRGPSGATVTLVGTNLGTAPGTVLYSGKATIVSWSDTSITVVLEAPRRGRRPVRARRPDGHTSNALTFEQR